MENPLLLLLLLLLFPTVLTGISLPVIVLLRSSKKHPRPDFNMNVWRGRILGRGRIREWIWRCKRFLPKPPPLHSCPAIPAKLGNRSTPEGISLPPPPGERKRSSRTSSTRAIPPRSAHRCFEIFILGEDHIFPLRSSLERPRISLPAIEGFSRSWEGIKRNLIIAGEGEEEREKEAAIDLSRAYPDLSYPFSGTA